MSVRSALPEQLTRAVRAAVSQAYGVAVPDHVVGACPGALSTPGSLSYPCCYVTDWVRSCFMDAVLQALADPSRRTVLEILRDHPATAGELAEALPIARPGVSRHLRVLRQAGLVEVRQEAQRRIYTLRPQALAEVDEWLGPYRELWRKRLGALHAEIDRGRKAQE